MAAKRNNLFLYLTLVCFVGIILIFIFDGYLGVYDTVVLDNGQYSQKIETDQWSQEKYDYRASTGVERGNQVEFTYTVENHRFSGYSADVEVSFLHNDEIISDPIVDVITAEAFGMDEMKWILDADAFVPADYPSEQQYIVNVLVKRDNVQREVLVNISGLPMKPVIIEPRPVR
ncbi:hypothetical protein ACFLWU_05415 [Chloroflexota bacterium]